MSTLDIVIVNWNAGEQLRQCVASVEETSYAYIDRVVVVDNDSSDGSVDHLDSGSLLLSLIRNSENRGFAAACNQGAQQSRADYLLFLNPDTKLERDSLSVAVSFIDNPQNHSVGVVGIQLVDERGDVQPTCARLPTPGRFIGMMLGLDRVWPHRIRPHFLSRDEHTESGEVEQVMGAFFLTRRTLFEELGGFDERFFVYLEEVDFTLRARQAGWKTCFLAEARALHRGGGSSAQIKGARLYYMLRSRILYFYKHFSRRQATAYTVCVFALELPARLLNAVLQKSSELLSSTLRGYRLLLNDIPNMIRQAWVERPQQTHLHYAADQESGT